MCGIAGVVRWGEKPIQEAQVGMLLVGNEHRGNDASGIAIQQVNGTVDIFKKDSPGWVMIGSKEYRDFIKEKLHPNSRCVLVHARGASQGNPRDNNNNHPMYAGLSAVVHNGVIRNDSELFSTMKLERRADTDSDILRAIVDEWGITREAITKMSRGIGGGAIAAVHPGYPDKLLLVRSGNPLTIASNEDFFFFSSEKTTLHKACRPFIERRGMWFQSQRPNVDFANMADDTGWIIGAKGLEVHLPCKICAKKYEEPWRKTYEEYSTRQQKWDHLATTKSNTLPIRGASRVKLGYCTMCKKEWTIPFDGVYHKYSCNKDSGGCGTLLSEPPTGIVNVMGRVN